MDNVYTITEFGEIFYTPRNTNTGIRLSSPALNTILSVSTNHRIAAANGYLFLGKMGDNHVYVYSLAEDVMFDHITLPSYVDDITVNHVA